jgi:hypothetical protein
MQFILGMVVGAALLWLVSWLRAKAVDVRWYELLLAALGFVMLLWTVNDFFASMAEHNETAGFIFLWLLGVPAIILISLPVFLYWWRKNRSKIAIESTTSR